MEPREVKMCSSARYKEFWRVHLAARIPPSQGGYTGSIPVRATVGSSYQSIVS